MLLGCCLNMEVPPWRGNRANNSVLMLLKCFKNRDRKEETWKLYNVQVYF